MRPVIHSRRVTGFTLVELVAVVVLIAVLAAVMLKTFVDYAEAAEKSAMEQVASSVRAGLHMRVAGMIALSADAPIAGLAKQNPMDWLAEKPHIYVGKIHGVAPPELAPPRSWYYDTRAHELVYRPSRTRHLSFPHNAHKEIRFKVWVEQGVLPGGESLPEPLRGVRRVELAPVEAYSWDVSAS
ncbi:MAG TPA: prepilin-type N-terminal cleavage/methylation domain-containing protein [Burkholderiales bacterium]|nr:prepilin-type N-terminal cleavage/methylation domain-containing protein [Burkholderiales bacterium]